MYYSHSIIDVRMALKKLQRKSGSNEVLCGSTCLRVRACERRRKKAGRMIMIFCSKEVLLKSGVRLL